MKKLLIWWHKIRGFHKAFPHRLNGYTLRQTCTCGAFQDTEIDPQGTYAIYKPYWPA